MHASIRLTSATRMAARDLIGETGDRHVWVDIEEPVGYSSVTIEVGTYNPSDAEIIASTGILIDALETLRGAAMTRLAAAVKADLPEAVAS